MLTLYNTVIFRKLLLTFTPVNTVEHKQEGYFLKIITIANRKGGTGKSTVSFNLGYTYALNKKKVLFIDLDSQGNLSLLNNVPTIGIETWKQIDPYEINEYISILPATKLFKQLENEINQLIDRNSYLKNEVLKNLKNLYDYIIIDTPPELSILNVNAFCISDMVHIIINPDYFSLSGLVEMKDILSQIKTINPILNHKIVLNGYVKNRNFTVEIDRALSQEPEYSGVEIPHRQHIIDCSALKKPAIDLNDIYNPFLKLSEVI